MRSKKRYRKGDQFTEHLIYEKEVFPLYRDGGKRKERRAFFQCSVHEGVFYKLTFRQARNYRTKTCACQSEKYNRYAVKHYKEDVDKYSYHTEANQIKRAHARRHPSWFVVQEHDVLVEGEIFYEFECKTDRRAAIEIENAIWNAKTPMSRAMFLTRLSYKLDELHMEGRIHYDNPLWARGAGVEFFKEYLGV